MPPTPDTPTRPPRQQPIIIQGFDYHEQLKLDFHSKSFVCNWLRRAYTDEDNTKIQRHIGHLTGKSRESRLREVRYGNNITLLFRACSACRKFFDSPEYWAAVGSGFSASADQVIYVAETLVRARKIYLDRSADAGPRSAATAAVDQWIDNLNRRAMESVYRPAANVPVFPLANHYYEDAKTRYLQVDSANMLSKPHVLDGPRTARKRSPSPTFAGTPPSAKRTFSETSFGRRGISPPPASLPLPPLKTNGAELKMLEQSRQPSQKTPINANEGMKHGDWHSQGQSPDSSNMIRVRGRAQQESFTSLSFRPPSKDVVPKSESISGELEQTQAANGLLRDRVAKLDKKLATMRISPQNGDAPSEIEKKLAMFEKRLASMESRPATKEPVTPNVKAVLAPFEEQLAQAEKRRVKDMEKVQAMIASLETRLSVSGSFESSPKQAEIIRDLQSRITSLEAQLAVTDVQSVGGALHGEQTQITPLESRVAVANTEPNAEGTSVMQDIIKRLASLEDGLLPAAQAKGDVDNVSANIMRVENKLILQDAVAEELNDRLSSLEKQHLESTKIAANKTFVEVNSKRLNDRLLLLEEQQREVDEYKARNEERFVALEVQVLRLLKTVETPITPTSPSQGSLQDVRHNMEDIWKKIQGLPTMTSVSEKTFQIEQHLRALLEQHQRDTNERLAGAVKDLGDAKAQIKGLLKLIDEATSGMAKTESVTALESKLSTLSRKLDVFSQSSPQTTQIEKLENKVEELGSDIQQALRAISSSNVANQVQDLSARVDGIEQSFEVAEVETLASEVALLHDRCNTLTACLEELVRQFTQLGS